MIAMSVFAFENRIIPLNFVNILSAYFCEFRRHIIVPQTMQINADCHTIFLQDLKG